MLYEGGILRTIKIVSEVFNDRMRTYHDGYRNKRD